MARELTEPEKFYIENHYLDMSPEEMAEAMDAKGVGPKTVEAFVETLPPPEEPTDEVEDRHKKLQKVKRDRTGQMMARDDKKDPRAVMMTKEASEMADANRKKRMSKEEYMREHGGIFIIDPKKKSK